MRLRPKINMFIFLRRRKNLQPITMQELVWAWLTGYTSRSAVVTSMFTFFTCYVDGDGKKLHGQVENLSQPYVN